MISFVYFDLGEAVTRDFSGTNLWEEFKAELGVTSKNDQAFEDFWTKYEPEVIVGRDIESLIPLLREQLGLNIPNNYSLLNAFVRRFEKNESIWPVLKLAKEKYKIGLLTNMYPGMLTAIKNKNIMPDIDWDVVIDSSLVGLAKPKLEIFKLAEEESGVKKDEIFFVENSVGNIEAAKNFGWQTFLYDSARPEASSRELVVYLSDQLGSLKDHPGDQLH